MKAIIGEQKEKHERDKSGERVEGTSKAAYAIGIVSLRT
jgi:hypothetical protein